MKLDASRRLLLARVA